MGSLFDQFPGRWPGLTSGRTVGAAKQDALDGTRRIVYNMAHKLHCAPGCAPALPDRQDCRCAAVDLSQFGEGKRSESRGQRQQKPSPGLRPPSPSGRGFLGGAKSRSGFPARPRRAGKPVLQPTQQADSSRGPWARATHHKTLSGQKFWQVSRPGATRPNRLGKRLGEGARNVGQVSNLSRNI